MAKREQSLVTEALKNGRPGFGATDVYENEPVQGGNHPLLTLPNAICTPHTAWLEPTTYEMYFGEAFQQAAVGVNAAVAQKRPVRARVVELGKVNGRKQHLLLFLTGAREDLAAAIGMNASLFNLAQILGPSAAGLIIVAFADRIELTRDLREGVLNGFAALIGRTGRVAAATGERRDGRHRRRHRSPPA